MWGEQTFGDLVYWKRRQLTHWVHQYVTSIKDVWVQQLVLRNRSQLRTFVEPKAGIRTQEGLLGRLGIIWYCNYVMQCNTDMQHGQKIWPLPLVALVFKTLERMRTTFGCFITLSFWTHVWTVFVNFFLPVDASWRETTSGFFLINKSTSGSRTKSTILSAEYNKYWKVKKTHTKNER